MGYKTLGFTNYNCLGEGKGMEWKEILYDIPSILHIGSLIRMKDRLYANARSIQNSLISIPSKSGRNNHSFIEIEVKYQFYPNIYINNKRWTV